MQYALHYSLIFFHTVKKRQSFLITRYFGILTKQVNEMNYRYLFNACEKTGSSKIIESAQMEIVTKYKEFVKKVQVR